MQLKRREKILAACTGILVLAAAGWILFSAAEGRSSGRLRAERDRLAADVAAREIEVQALRRAGERIARWERQSLPTDRALARSLYQDWLRSLATRAGFRQVKFDPPQDSKAKSGYALLSFKVRGRATLAQLTQFLHGFYSAGHLHQIRGLQVKPGENTREVLEVQCSIEALSLPGCDRKNQLCREPGKRLKLAKLTDYSQVIVDRNLFAPAVLRVRSRPNEFDPLKYTVVTAIVEVDSRPQVWLVDRPSGRTWRLDEGGVFEVGGVRGRVTTIGRHDLVLDLDGQQRRLRKGDSLREGKEVQDEKPPSPD